MLWRQYRPLPASDVSEFVCSFAYEVLNVRVAFPLQGASDCCDPYSAVLCQQNLASLPKFYCFSLCHLDYNCYICILNIYWAFCELIGFVSLRSVNDCKGSNNYQNKQCFSDKIVVALTSFNFVYYHLNNKRPKINNYAAKEQYKRNRKGWCPYRAHRNFASRICKKMRCWASKP